MDSIQTLYGKCRCCLKAGEHRDILEEYYCDGTREIYFDIFLECFNVFLSSSESCNLICVDCIQKLRDANNFRKMVVNAEKQLQSVKLKDAPVFEIKLETLEVKQEPDDDQDYMETDCTDVDPTTDDTLARDEARLLARFPKGLRALPTRNTLYELCPKYVMHLDMLQGKKTRTKDIAALLELESEVEINQQRHQQYVTEKAGHVHNAQLILEHSNVTAFKGKSRVGLPCFYCKDIFENIEALRTHQQTHSKSDIKKSLISQSPYCLIVNVDISDLKCTICDASVSTLKDLKSHLETHSKKIYTEFEDRVIPFKVPTDNNFICQICGQKYETFGSVERHMNIHYRNYICEECGTGFVTSYRLKMHVKTMHVEGSFQCETCEKVFLSHQKLKSHVDTVHKMKKRFKCTKCSERFTDYFKRHQHLVEIHGQKDLEYKCNVCDKVYGRRYMLSRHMKRDHLEERYFECEICSNKFFAKRDLESHMVKHNGARIFECGVCKKAYARKKTLTEHMRIHNNDRRFCCAVCGQAFVQNCSLKGHMKTHHPEYVGFDEK